jgi:hypothetical protein
METLIISTLLLSLIVHTGAFAVSRLISENIRNNAIIQPYRELWPPVLPSRSYLLQSKEKEDPHYPQDEGEKEANISYPDSSFDGGNLNPYQDPQYPEVRFHII